MAPGIETRSEPGLIELRHDKAGGALFFTVLFHIWGWVGLLMAVVSVVATTFHVSLCHDGLDVLDRWHGAARVRSAAGRSNLPSAVCKRFIW